MNKQSHVFFQNSIIFMFKFTSLKIRTCLYSLLLATMYALVLFPALCVAGKPSNPSAKPALTAEETKRYLFNQFYIHICDGNYVDANELYFLIKKQYGKNQAYQYFSNILNTTGYDNPYLENVYFYPPIQKYIHRRNALTCF